jgi:hypothetical protein
MNSVVPGAGEATTAYIAPKCNLLKLRLPVAFAAMFVVFLAVVATSSSQPTVADKLPTKGSLHPSFFNAQPAFLLAALRLQGLLQHLPSSAENREGYTVHTYSATSFTITFPLRLDQVAAPLLVELEFTLQDIYADTYVELTSLGIGNETLAPSAATPRIENCIFVGHRPGHARATAFASTCEGFSGHFDVSNNRYGLSFYDAGLNGTVLELYRWGDVPALEGRFSHCGGVSPQHSLLADPRQDNGGRSGRKQFDKIQKTYLKADLKADLKAKRIVRVLVVSDQALLERYVF